MAQNIPKQGIKAYMDVQALKLTPPSAWWKCGVWISKGRGFSLMLGFGMIFLAFIFGADFFPLLKEWYPIGNSAGVLMFGMLFFSQTMGAWARRPGEWRRYSVKDFLEHFDKSNNRSMDQLRHVISQVRQEDWMAEFEIAVLQQKFVIGGYILFQVCGRNESGEPYKEQAIQIFQPGGQPIRFGDAYALA